MPSPLRRKVQTVFVSDIHLGTRHCQAELVSNFLDAHEAKTIYLVGDIIDGWRLKRSWYWPETHEAVVQSLLTKASLGTKVIFIPGNHDEFARVYAGRLVANVAVRDEVVHRTADGLRYLVIHGDQYDPVMQRAKWLAHLGDWFYELALTSNTAVNWARRRFGLGYWSLGAFAKRHVKSFIGIIGQFETVVAEDVRRRGLHGVICGHIHHAVSREMAGIHYLNAGDWVESCTAIIEDFDGRLEVVRWTEGASDAVPADASAKAPISAPETEPGGRVV